MNQKDDHGKTIDALNEMVGSGMKQLAISQPFASVQERKALLPVVEESCAKHHTNYYLEDRLLVSDLFPISFSEGRCVILFYRDEQVIRSYAGSNHIELYRWNADVYNKVEGTNYPDWMTLCFPQTQTNYSNIEPNPIPVAPTATSPEHEW